MASRYRTIFESNQLKKTYLAVVRGWPNEEGAIDRSLKCPESGRVQSAKTTFRRLATAAIEKPIGKFPTGRFALLEVQLESGRWHQIRRHVNGVTHPVVGDSTHGDTRFNRYAKDNAGIDRLMLHASKVEFEDPRGYGFRRFEAPLESDMAQVLERFKWPVP
jgi:tRNA pseudouridine65 synthase|tara:strand:+ start:2690 stop:3175 length:486 start_codon:yes stop_codon:yes gene_type:complete